MFFAFIAFGFGVVLLAHTAPFPFLLDSLEDGHALWRIPGSADPPEIYLTFDDGPNPETTPSLLDVLAGEQVSATFFLIDRHVNEETAPIIRRMFDEGHSVALHSHTRALMVMSPDELALTLTQAADRIEAFTARRPCAAFRPHAGWRSGNMYAGLAQLDHKLVGWTPGLWDWNWYRKPRPEALVKRLIGRVSAGNIIVMHDGHHVNPRADRRYTVDTVARLVPELRAKGFTFGTICEHL